MVVVKTSYAIGMKLLGAVALMIRVIALLALLLPNFSYAECINAIDTVSDLIKSNLCTYANSAIVEIEQVKLAGWYNPFACFSKSRKYEYQARVLSSVKGNNSHSICLFEILEDGSFHARRVKGKQYLVSFNYQSGCSLIDVGGIVEITSVNKENVEKIITDESIRN